MELEKPRDIPLGERGYSLRVRRLPTELIPTESEQSALWLLKPEGFSLIKMHRKEVALPRWQRAYERDYVFSGQRSEAEPIPAPFRPIFEWVREEIDPRLNGVLVNWYDGALKHYIGPHRDRFGALIEGAPIVTVSLGEERVFRLQEYRGKGRMDLTVEHGDVLELPFQANKEWKHSVPHFARYRGKRISVTVRAFRDDR